MVKIRLARGGAKKKPFYSIVATDSRKRRDSGYIERIGYFNPVARGQEVRLTIEEVHKFLIAFNNLLKNSKTLQSVKSV